MNQKGNTFLDSLNSSFQISNYSLLGHTRQGLKCKLCRTNIHTECLDPGMKCQPKSRLLRRQKSASEIEARFFGGGDQAEAESKF